jgi:hypothetical protein
MEQGVGAVLAQVLDCAVQLDAAPELLKRIREAPEEK